MLRDYYNNSVLLSHCWDYTEFKLLAKSDHNDNLAKSYRIQPHEQVIACCTPSKYSTMIKVLICK